MRLLDSHVYALWPQAMGCHPSNNNNSHIITDITHVACQIFCFSHVQMCTHHVQQTHTGPNIHLAVYAVHLPPVVRYDIVRCAFFSSTCKTLASFMNIQTMLLQAHLAILDGGCWQGMQLPVHMKPCTSSMSSYTLKQQNNERMQSQSARSFVNCLSSVSSPISHKVPQMKGHRGHGKTLLAQRCGYQ